MQLSNASSTSADLSTESVQATVLLFVHLEDDSSPKSGKEYRVIPAHSDELASLEYPTSEWTSLDMDIQTFYSGDMPDFTENNEGVMRLQIDAINPQDKSDSKAASQLLKFSVKDYKYAPGFNTRGAFARVVFGQHVNLTVEVDELDQDASVIFNKIEAVVSESGLAEVDVVKNFPYLDVGVKLMKSVVQNFGRNPDDPVWSDRLILRKVPIPGSAYLRSGIYFLVGRDSLPETDDQFTFKDEQLLLGGVQVRSTHFRFGIGLTPA